MIACPRPVSRYAGVRYATRCRLRAAIAILAVGAPTAALSQSPSDSTKGRQRIQPLPALGSSPETGLQCGATVLAVIDRPTMEHARPASLIATALRSTNAQTRIAVEGEQWTRQNARRVNAQLAWQKFPLPYYGIGEGAATSDKETFAPNRATRRAAPEQQGNRHPAGDFRADGGHAPRQYF